MIVGEYCYFPSLLAATIVTVHYGFIMHVCVRWIHEVRNHKVQQQQ
jgi:hypothetical protein